MLIREARASDAAHLVRFINMAADDLPLHFWKRSVGPEGDPWAYGRERARADRQLLLPQRLAGRGGGRGGRLPSGLSRRRDPGPIDPDTPPIFVPLLELEALAPGSWYLNVLATYEAFRGKGLGSALLAHAETRGAGCRAPDDQPDRRGHPSEALRLYTAKGFAKSPAARWSRATGRSMPANGSCSPKRCNASARHDQGDAIQIGRHLDLARQPRGVFPFVFGHVQHGVLELACRAGPGGPIR
jgi:GNAT superfamily N-acetyltransferase